MLTVTDTFGVSNASETTLTIYNNEPTASFTFAPDPPTPNQMIAFDGRNSSHDRPDRNLVSYEWDFDFDGSTFDIDASGSTTSHVYTTFADHTVALRVTDDNSPAKTDIAIVVVSTHPRNDPPMADAGGPYMATEGVSLSLDGRGSSDPEDANTALRFEWDLDYRESSFDVDATGEQPVVMFADDFLEGVIALRVTDSAGASQIATTTVTAANSDPVLTTNKARVAAAVGAQAVNTGTYGDVPADTVTLTASIGQVYPLDASHWLWLLNSGTPLSQVVTITAVDDDGGTTESTFNLVTFNLPPLITEVTGDTTGDEGSLFAFHADVLNLAGTGGSLTYHWDFGDGSAAVTGENLENIEHRYSARGVHTLTVTVFDDPEKTGTVRRLSVTVNNVVPTLTATLATVTVVEGTSATNTGTFDDVGDDTVIITALPGIATQDNVAGTWSWSLPTTDGPDGPRTVTITATDSDGAVSTKTFDLTVENAPPTLTATLATVTVVEGTTATNTGTFDDVGDDTVIITALPGIATQDNVAGTWSWSLPTTDGPDVPRTVTITATDSDGAVSTKTFSLNVENAPPTLTATLATVTVVEGTSATNTGTFGDVGDDTVIITALPGIATQDNAAGTWSWSLPTTDGPDGPRTVTITATDSDGAVSTKTFDLTVENAPPTLTATLATVTVVEGTSATNTGTFGDVGDDTVIITALPGIVTQDNAAGTWSWSLPTTDGPDGPRTVTITATDSDGAVSTKTFDLTVENAPPKLTATLATVTVVEGTSATNTGTFDDVGDDTVIITALPGIATQDNAAGTWSWSLPTTDGPDGPRTVTITATDSDGAVSTKTFDLNVDNAPATLTATLATVTVVEGTTATNTGTFGDVGDDTVIITALPGIATQDNVAGTWSWSLPTTDGPDGPRTVTITATDSDGDVSTKTFSLNVENAPPTVSANRATVTVDRGQTATNTGPFDDAGNDTVTVAASIGSVTQDYATKQWTWTFAATATSPATQTVTLTAIDSDEAETQTSFVLTLNTVDPIVRRALQLDAELRLSSTSSPRANLLGLNEKWLVGVNKQLYYITPTGDLYAWGSGFPHVSTLVATLSPAYHTDPALLSAAATFLDTSPAALPSTLALLDEVYGFKFANERWENWGNRGENWFKDRNDSWYFILPNGEVYAWDGMPRATGEFLVNVGTTVHANPELLWNAYVTPEGEASVTDLLEISAAAATRPSISLDDISPPFPIRIGAWTNPLNILDVNGDGLVSPIDVLVVVNRLNDMERAGISNRLTAVIPTPESGTYYDVTNDGFVSPLDALLIINAFNDLPLPNGEARRTTAS